MSQHATQYNQVYEAVEKLSLFDLKNLEDALSNLLDDPERNLAVKRHLKPGMTIYYKKSNQTMVEAVVIDIRNTIATVLNVVDNQRWNIYLFSIDLEGRDTLILPKRAPGKLDRNSLKIGDGVGYHSKENGDVFGVVKKLNPKKAVITLNNGEIWNVPYSLLFLVIDGISMNSQGCLLIEGEVVKSQILS